MRVLIVGGGGREHALAWKLARSPGVARIYVAPGNAGMEELAEIVPLGADRVDELRDLALERKIDLTVVGPEAPLVEGLADRFSEKGLRVFGPSRLAARLEASKIFSKEFLGRHAIPTAAHEVFDDPKAAFVYMSESSFPLVIKADGLAAGKGVVVAESLEAGRKTIQRLMVDRVFGSSGRRVVIEEFLDGAEVSILTFCDGERHLPLFASQDHKRALDGNRGPNTGGMGAYAPLGFLDEDLLRQIHDEILTPAVRGMAAEGNPYRGILYAGLMLTERGPRVLEFNCRFGDPETQVVLPLLEEDLAPLMMECVEGRLRTEPLARPARHAAGIVLASHGYPGFYETGFPIEGLEEARELGCLVFHAGTAREAGRIVTAGGRVLAVVATAETLRESLDLAYQGCEVIEFEGKSFRKDIGAFGLDPRGRSKKFSV